MNTASLSPQTLKFRVLNKSPFYGSILMTLPVEELPGLGTAGVDGQKLYYDPEWWQTLKYSEQMGVLIHEVAHLVLGHIWREGSRNDMVINPQTGQGFKLFNIAADHAVNLLLIEEFKRIATHREGVAPALPAGGVADPKYKEWTAEAIYEDLKKKVKQAPPSAVKQFLDKAQGNAAATGTHDKWNSRTKAQAKQDQADMGQKIRHAYEHAKSKGQLPEGIARVFKELEPKEDWRDILMDYVSTFADDYSFSPSDRRFADSDFILPDLKDGEEIDWIAIAVDTSGSITDQELNHFLSEVKAMIEAYDRVRVKVTFCDAKATPFIELTEWEPGSLKVEGGGGTDFRPVFKQIAEEESAPRALIYFTDLMGDFPDQEPDYDMWWVATDLTTKAPFGKVLDYRI